MHQTRPVNGTDWATQARFLKAWIAARRGLADWLRQLAARVDTRCTLVIAVEISAGVTTEQLVEALRFGKSQTLFALDEVLQEADTEASLRREFPHLLS